MKRTISWTLGLAWFFGILGLWVLFRSPKATQATHLPESMPQTLIQEFKVGSRIIHYGQLSDDALPLLGRYVDGKPSVSGDPKFPGSLVVGHYYKLGSKEYEVVCRRFNDSGPYRISQIFEADASALERVGEEYNKTQQRLQTKP